MSTVEFEKSGFLAHIRLNRPDKLNAVNPAMVAAIDAALDDAENDEAIRCILLSGNGRAFSAGFDINATEVREGETGDVAIRRELQQAFDVIMRVWDCSKPVVCAVHGYCLGSALEMSAVCDLTIASEDCLFGTPEPTFGSGMVCLILPYIIGFKHASEMLLLGRKDMSAQRAAEIGLINRVVAADSLMDEAKSIAKELAMNDRLAVVETRHAMRNSLDLAGLREALHQALETDVKIETTETAESAEFNRVLAESGLRAALDWRSTKLDNADS